MYRACRSVKLLRRAVLYGFILAKYIDTGHGFNVSGMEYLRFSISSDIDTKKPAISLFRQMAGFFSRQY